MHSFSVAFSVDSADDIFSSSKVITAFYEEGKEMQQQQHD
jgi:hypothetical protein